MTPTKFKLMMASAPIALITAFTSSASAGEITDFGGIFGDGFIFCGHNRGNCRARH